MDGNPAAGVQGSIVPAASIEFDQREVVEVITRANVRGYKDFTGAACAIPSNADQTQLRKAIEGFIGDINPYIIDSEVTYSVHGPGAFFPDLITAMNYLGHYKITPRGHVILQLGGAASGAATKYTYTNRVIFNHPNNDRISVIGARMLKPVPLDDSGYASNGSSAGQRATDLITNLAVMRSCFATELHFQGVPNIGGSNFGSGAIMIDGTMLMHLDAILFTGDTGCVGMYTTCQGVCNGTLVSGVPTISGIAFLQFSYGIIFDAGSSIVTQGAGFAQNLWAPIITIGNSGQGIVVLNGSFYTTFGNVITLGNGADGIVCWPGAGIQLDGGLFACSNAQNGLNLGGATPAWVNGPWNGGATYGPSHFYKNGGWGCSVNESGLMLYGDCGAGANLNGSGSVGAWNGSVVSCNDINVSAHCSPPWGTTGNSLSMVV